MFLSINLNLFSPDIQHGKLGTLRIHVYSRVNIDFPPLIPPKMLLYVNMNLFSPLFN
jgi:hypothetical protein